VWKASDGTANKTVSDDGNCTNMLYEGTTQVQLRTPGMCHILGSAGDGAFTLQVTQSPYSYKYTATFSDDNKTMKLTRDGKDIVTLTQVPGAH
jgi:hypothetical protein